MKPMQESALVCICIPTYNVAATIGETLESILAQTYSNLRIKLVDNASTDATLKVIASYKDPRITVYRHDENVGGEGNFNRCIGLGEGDFTAIFHADDIYQPDMVAQQVAFLQQYPEAGAVFTSATTIDAQGREVGAIDLPSEVVLKSNLYDFQHLFKAILRYSNFLNCPSAMVRTSVYQQDIKAWNGEAFGSSADLDVWLRIAQRYPVGVLQTRLMKYRISDQQFSAQLRKTIARADFFRVTEHYLAQPATYALLSAQDLRNYQRLDTRDQLMRAVNVYLSAPVGQKPQIPAAVFSGDTIYAALTTRRGLFIMLTVIFLGVASLPGGDFFVRKLLTKAKQISRK